MTKKNVLYAIIMVVVIGLIAGCASTSIVKAVEQTDDEVTFVTIPEPTTEVISTTVLVDTLVEESTVEEMAEIIKAEADPPAEKAKNTIVVNGFETYFVDADFFEGVDDLHLLAGFIQYEGGEAFERMLIAQIVMDTLNRETSPHDALAELLTDRRYFGILERYWNIICAEITDENLLIAETVLSAVESNNDVTVYDGYFYADTFGIPDVQGFNESDFKFSFTTKHYVFYQR